MESCLEGLVLLFLPWAVFWLRAAKWSLRQQPIESWSLYPDDQQTARHTVHGWQPIDSDLRD